MDSNFRIGSSKEEVTSDSGLSFNSYSQSVSGFDETLDEMDGTAMTDNLNNKLGDVDPDNNPLGNVTAKDDFDPFEIKDDALDIDFAIPSTSTTAMSLSTSFMSDGSTGDGAYGSEFQNALDILDQAIVEHSDLHSSDDCLNTHTSEGEALHVTLDDELNDLSLKTGHSSMDPWSRESMSSGDVLDEGREKDFMFEDNFEVSASNASHHNGSGGNGFSPSNGNVLHKFESGIDHTIGEITNAIESLGSQVDTVKNAGLSMYGAGDSDEDDDIGTNANLVEPADTKTETSSLFVNLSSPHSTAESDVKVKGKDDDDEDDDDEKVELFSVDSIKQGISATASEIFTTVEEQLQPIATNIATDIATEIQEKASLVSETVTDLFASQSNTVSMPKDDFDVFATTTPVTNTATAIGASQSPPVSSRDMTNLFPTFDTKIEESQTKESDVDRSDQPIISGSEEELKQAPKVMGGMFYDDDDEEEEEEEEREEEGKNEIDISSNDLSLTYQMANKAIEQLSEMKDTYHSDDEEREVFTEPQDNLKASFKAQQVGDQPSIVKNPAADENTELTHDIFAPVQFAKPTEELISGDKPDQDMGDEDLLDLLPSEAGMMGDNKVKDICDLDLFKSQGQEVAEIQEDVEAELLQLLPSGGDIGVSKATEDKDSIDIFSDKVTLVTRAVVEVTDLENKLQAQENIPNQPAATFAEDSDFDTFQLLRNDGSAKSKTNLDNEDGGKLEGFSAELFNPENASGEGTAKEEYSYYSAQNFTDLFAGATDTSGQGENGKVISDDSPASELKTDFADFSWIPQPSTDTAKSSEKSNVEDGDLNLTLSEVQLNFAKSTNFEDESSQNAEETSDAKTFGDDFGFTDLRVPDKDELDLVENVVPVGFEDSFASNSGFPQFSEVPNHADSQENPDASPSDEIVQSAGTFVNSIIEDAQKRLQMGLESFENDLDDGMKLDLSLQSEKAIPDEKRFAHSEFIVKDEELNLDLNPSLVAKTAIELETKGLVDDGDINIDFGADFGEETSQKLENIKVDITDDVDDIRLDLNTAGDTQPGTIGDIDFSFNAEVKPVEVQPLFTDIGNRFESDRHISGIVTRPGDLDRANDNSDDFDFDFTKGVTSPGFVRKPDDLGKVNDLSDDFDFINEGFAKSITSPDAVVILPDHPTGQSSTDGQEELEKSSRGSSSYQTPQEDDFDFEEFDKSPRSSSILHKTESASRERTSSGVVINVQDLMQDKPKPTAHTEELAHVNLGHDSPGPMNENGMNHPDLQSSISEWDQVQTIIPEIAKDDVPAKYKPKVQLDVGTSSSIVEFPEALEYFKSADLSQYQSIIKPAIERRGLAAIKRFLFGPPRLQQDLIPERDLAFCVAACPFENNDPMHVKVLQTIYKKLTGSKFDCPRLGGHWEIIGFQGNDPSTDLRGTGFLALLHLLYFLTDSKLYSEALDIYKLSLHQTQNFPFCLMSINMTRIALQVLRQECINRECNRQRAVMLPLAEFYVGLFSQLAEIWRTQHKSIADSGFVIKDLENWAKKNPKAVTKSFQMAQQSKLKKTTSKLVVDDAPLEFMDLCKD